MNTQTSWWRRGAWVGLPVLGALVVALLVVRPHTPPVYAANVIFVDARATGSATGLSWTDAFTNVQDALALAATGDHIWVADGTYYPDEGQGQTNNNREAVFQLKAGVAIYGGFAGGETSLDQRDPQAHVAILSGDLEQNDLASPVISPTAEITGDNAYHVVLAETALLTDTLLDGFTITAGQANGIGANRNQGGGILARADANPTFANLVVQGNLASTGGGIYNGSGTPTYRDIVVSNNVSLVNGAGIYNEATSTALFATVTVRNNTANNDGGGVYNASSNTRSSGLIVNQNSAARNGGGVYGGDATDTFEDARITNNTAVFNGGGFYMNQGRPLLSNSTISDNSTGNDGGGFYLISTTLRLENVQIFRNRAGRDGGGLAVVDNARDTLISVSISGNQAVRNGGGVFSNNSPTTLVNTLFSGNGAASGAAAYHFQSAPTYTNVTVASNAAGNVGGAFVNDNGSAPLIQNSILWGNTPDQIRSANSTPTVRDTLIEGGGITGTNIITGNPLFRAPLTAATAPTSDGDYRLQPASPAIDVGNNSYLPAGITTDRAGRARIVGGTVDLGAYEWDVDPTPTSTPSNTPTATASPTATSTPSSTPTSTAVLTATPTSTAVLTATPTSTAVLTATPTSTAVLTATPTSTAVLTATPTSTATATATATPTATPTAPPVTGQITLTPDISNTLTITDRGYLLVFVFPAGAVTQTVTLNYNGLPQDPGNLSEQQVSVLHFSLLLLDPSQIPPDGQPFVTPYTLTISRISGDPLDPEQNPQIYGRTTSDGTWQPAPDRCRPPSGCSQTLQPDGSLIVGVDYLGEFALGVDGTRTYLPLVRRGE